MPVLAMILYFKINLAPPNDLVSGGRGIGEVVWKLKDYSRYVQILRAFITGILFTIPQVILLIFYPLYVGFRYANKRKIVNFTALLALTLITVGYFCVYLITPYDLSWHLTWSLDRILLQLWPSILFTYFMSVRTTEEAIIDSQIETLQKEI